MCFVGSLGMRGGTVRLPVYHTYTHLSCHKKVIVSAHSAWPFLYQQSNLPPIWRGSLRQTDKNRESESSWAVCQANVLLHSVQPKTTTQNHWLFCHVICEAQTMSTVLTLQQNESIIKGMSGLIDKVIQHLHVKMTHHHISPTLTSIHHVHRQYAMVYTGQWSYREYTMVCIDIGQWTKLQAVCYGLYRTVELQAVCYGLYRTVDTVTCSMLWYIQDSGHIYRQYAMVYTGLLLGQLPAVCYGLYRTADTVTGSMLLSILDSGHSYWQDTMVYTRQ